LIVVTGQRRSRLCKGADVAARLLTIDYTEAAIS
jgi:hypothetical protein